MLSISSQSFAATFYWDGNGTGAAGSGDTPAGTWGSSIFWTTDSTGANIGSPTLTAITTALDDVFFSAGSDAINAYTVGLNSATQSARLVTFEDGTVTLNNGTLSLGAGGGITVAGTTITGATISSNLTLSGGQTFNVAAGRTLTLNTGTFTRNAGATLNILNTGTITSTMTNLSANDATGIIGNWASFNTGTATTYAKFSGSTVTGLGYTGGADGTSVADATALTTGATTNFTYAGGAGALGGTSFNTLRYTGAGGTMTGNFTTNGLMNASGNALTYSGTVTIGSGNALVVNAASGNITLSAAVGGTAGATLTKTGTGTLILTAANTYTGVTTINQGTLQLGNGGLTGSLPATNNITINSGATLATNNTTGFFIPGAVISGAGSITVLGGELALNSGAHTYSGGLTLQAGTLWVGSNAAALGTGTLTLAGGTFSTSFTGAAGQTLTTTNANIWSGNFTVYGRVTGGTWNNNGTVLLSGGSRTVTGNTFTALNLGGVISDGGNGFGLTFTGLPAVTMSAVNTYTGGTTISSGVALTVSGSGSLGAGNYAGAISNVGTLNYSSSADQIFSGAITGASGILNKNTSATSTLTLSGTNANSYSGLTTVSAGTLVLNKLNGVSAVQAIAGALTVGSAGTTAAKVQYAASTTNPDMMGLQAISLLGRGILDFNGASDSIGNIAITATGAGANTTPIMNTAGGGNITIGSLAITPAAGYTSVVNAGTGTITLGADVTFTAAGTGQAQITSGVGGALSLGNANRTFTVGRGFGSDSDLLVDAQITGARSLTKAGVGRLTLSNNNAYTLGTTVSAGTLLLNGAFNMPSAGTLAVSATGMFSLADGTARATTGATSGVGLTLASGSYMSFDWNDGSLDSFTTSGTATSVAGNVVLDIRSVSPSGSGGTLISAAAGSTLNNATYLLANNTNFTATISKSATAVSIGSPTFLTSLTDAYWKGGQVTGFLGTMTVSTGTLSNWASDATGTASGLTPGNTTNLIFGATGAAQQANVITGLSDMSVNSITFNDSTAVTIAGSPNTITLNSTSGTAATTSGALASVTAGSAISVTSFANATNTISANLALGVNQTWNVASGKTLAVSGVVLGSGSLTKADTGTVTLSGANIYTGGTTISAGTIKIGSAASPLGVGAVSVNSGAVLDLNATAMTGTNALTINGTGIGGTGALVGNGNSTYAGTITLGSASTIGNSSGTMNLSNVINLNGSTLTLDGAGSFNLDFAGNNITGAGGIIKNGSGQLIVNSGQNQSFPFTGDIVLNGGSIGWQNGASFFAGKNTKITGGYLGARFGSSVTWSSGLGTGANQIQITGGTSGFSGEGATNSTFQIGSALSTLVWGASGQGSATGFFNPTILLLNGTDRMNANGKGNLNNGIDLNGATRTITSTHTTDNAAGSGFTISGVVSNSSGTASGLTKTGPGNLILGSANTFNGVTTVSAGFLTLSNALGLQNSVLDATNSVTGSVSAGLRITPTTMTLGGLNGTKNLSSLFTSSTGGYTLLTALTLNPAITDTATYSGIIANGAANMTLTKTGLGTQTLRGANSYSGATAVNFGTLALGNGGSLGATAVTVATGATFAVTQNASGTSNTGTTSTFVMNAGSSLNMADGFTSTLNITGATTLAAASGAATTLSFNFDSADTVSDRLAITGAGTIGAGKAIINLVPLATPSANTNTYNLITAGGGGMSTANYTLAGVLNYNIGGALYNASLSTSTATATTLSFVAGAVTPATAYWQGGTNGSWASQDGSNFLTNFTYDAAGGNNTLALPGSTSSVFIAANAVTNATATLNQAFSIAGLTFTGAGTANTAGSAIAAGTGGTLTLGTGGMTVQSGSGANTISAPVTLGAAQSWTNNSANLLTVNGGVTGGANLLTFAGTGATTISGATAFTTSTGATVSASTGAVSISAPITMGGATTFTNNSGNLLTVSGAIDNGANLLTIAGSGSTTISNTIGSGATKTGGLTVNASGATVTLGGSNAYTGNTTLTAGTLRLENTSAIAASPVVNMATGTTLQLRKDTTGGTFTNTRMNPTGTVTLNADRISAGSGQTLTLGGAIVYVSSAASQINFTGANTYNVGVNGMYLNTTGNAAITLNPTTANAVIGAIRVNTSNSNLDGWGAGTASNVGLVLGGTATNNTITSITEISNATTQLIITKNTAATWNISGNIDTKQGNGHTISAGTLNMNGGSFIFGAGAARALTVSGTGVLGYNNAAAVQTTNASALLTMAGGSIDNTSGAAITTSTTNPNMSWTGNWTFIGSNGADSNLNLGTGAVSLTATRQVSVTNAATTLTVGGVISGTGFGVTKAGAGTLTVAGLSTYTGTTTVQAGALVAGANAPLSANGAFGNAASSLVLGNASTLAGDAPSVLIGGAFTVARSITVGTGAATAYNAILGGSNTSGTSIFSGGITLTDTGSYTTTLQAATGGTVDFQSVWTNSGNKAIAIGSSGNAGTVKLTSAISTSGGINVNFGTLLLGSNDRLSNTTPVTVAGGTLDMADLTDTVASFSMSSGALNGTGTLTAATYGLTGGTLSAKLGAGAVTVNGNVTLGSAGRLNSSSSLLLQGGTLTLSGDENVASFQQTGGTLAGGFAINSAAAYDLQSGTISGNLGGSSGLTKTGDGTTTLSGTNTYTGATNVTNGTLQLDGSTHASSTANIGTAGTLTGTGTINGNATLTGNGVINKSSGTIAGTLGVTGGNWNGNGAVTGLITSSSGTFTIGNGANLTANGNLDVTGGTLAAGNSSSTITGSLNYTSASSSAFGGIIAGSSKTLTLNNSSAVLTLTGTNTYTGATNVNAGILNVSSAGNINSSASINVAAGGTLRYNSSTALTVAPTLQGNGASNRAVLGGAGSIGVAVTLNNLGDVLSPGNSPGIQTYTTAQTWSSFTYDWEVNDFAGLDAGTAFDQLNLTTLNLTGSTGSYVLNVLGLSAENASGLVPNFSEISRSWTILTTSGGITGFNAANWSIDPTGFSDPHTGNWSLAQTGNDLVLSYTVIPEPKAALLGGIGLLLLLRRRR